jgi:hypothetical protein
MKVRITVTADFEIDPKWIDEDGNLTHINDPVKVGGAKPLETREPVAATLKRLLNRPYYLAGSTPQHVTGWDVTVKELKR